MASTHGRKPLPLPASLVDGLASLGFIEAPPPGSDTAPRGTHSYRMPRHPDLFLLAVSSNIAGDAAVIAEWKGHGIDRVSPDVVLAALAVDVKLADERIGFVA